ncbi:MAG: hypothetical protein ACO4AJ_06000 [Prochlorothrix sp.]
MPLASALTLLWGSGAVAQTQSPSLGPGDWASGDAMQLNFEAGRPQADPHRIDPHSLPPSDEWLWSPLDRSAPAPTVPSASAAQSPGSRAPAPSSQGPAPTAASPPATSTSPSLSTSTPSPPSPRPNLPPASTVSPPSSPSQAPRLALSFHLPPRSFVPHRTQEAVPLPATIAQIAEDWWHRGSDSPLAIAIGSAEGTRTPQGDKTPAYYWHRDPGNGADNFGTFSYQHLSAQEAAPVHHHSTTPAKRTAAAEAQLPEQADRRQLERLRRFQEELRAQARAKGMTLSLVELINGLDLANQSEAAALSAWGYIDRLAQMRDRFPNDPNRQILEARTWAYWSPERHSWDAPGLGNTYPNIQRDQNLRIQAIQAALVHQGQYSSTIAQAIIEYEY